MTTTISAVLRERGVGLSIEDGQVADPRQGDVSVRLAGSGVRHTDLGVIPRLLQLQNEGKFPFETLIQRCPATKIDDAIQAAHDEKINQAVVSFGGRAAGENKS